MANIDQSNHLNFCHGPEISNSDPKQLIPELCRQFYNLGWASGTGGGLSIRTGGFIYCAPSGVQKERIQPEDIFVLKEDGQVVQRPTNDALKCSECLPLFMVAYKLRDAGCSIHSHSTYANLVTAFHSEKNLASMRDKQQFGGERTDNFCTEFRISHQEMIKGIKIGSSGRNLQYDDTLVVPIIDNVLHEKDLTGALHAAVQKYPDTNAVLVRNHGVYIWGKTWQEAKSQAECYHYLFKLKMKSIQCGLQ